MKKKLLPLVLFGVVMFTAGCAEEVVPTEQSLDTELIIELDDTENETEDDDEDEGVDPIKS